MARGRQLTVEFVGDTKDLEKAFGRVGSQSKTMGQNVRRGAGIAGGAILGGLAVAARQGFKEFARAEQATAQTEAVLKSMGNAANVTAGDIDKLSNKISDATGIDETLIQENQNLLLTFGNIRNELGKGNDIFDQTTGLMVDMSTALGQDMKSSAIQLGKALNDPIKGVSALQRVGVSFTAQQKDQIKALVESGDVMGAQKLILSELEKQFGGSAAAAGDTFAGQMMKLRETFDDVAASVISGLMPSLMALAGWIGKVTVWMRENEGATKVIAAALLGLGLALVTVSAALKIARAAMLVATAAQWLWNIALAANPIGLVIVGIVALGAALVILWKKSETFRRVMTGAFNAVKTVAGAMVKGILTGIDKALGALQKMLEVASKLPKRLGGGKFEGAAAAVAGARQSIRGDVAPPVPKNATASRGTQVNIGAVSLPGVTNPHDFIRDIRKISARSPAQTRGPHTAPAG
jgi:hypothetical protein